MSHQAHNFGGSWTADKLERLRKYLHAYMQIMKDRNFRVTYIDAFAGTGYVDFRSSQSAASLLPSMSEERGFVEGSARLALHIEPPFTRYIFIERRHKHAGELQVLRDEFADLSDRIIVERADANEYIQDLCLKRDWSNNRAVMFLDPYGMQVRWETITAIAHTQAIDLWLLFPLGVAVNRLMKRNGQIAPAHHRRLNEMFGATDWFEAFYRKQERTGLFDDDDTLVKVANFDSIGHYFTDRLRTIFHSVADNPLPLYNSRNSPLYLLCFAAGNPRGGPTAVKIAQHILRR